VDKSGQCPAVHAGLHGHLDALIYLLQCDWSEYDGQLTKVEAMQQAMVASAATGHVNVSTQRSKCGKLSGIYTTLDSVKVEYTQGWAGQ
jgi:hypothetical protein